MRAARTRPSLSSTVALCLACAAWPAALARADDDDRHSCRQHDRDDDRDRRDDDRYDDGRESDWHRRHRAPLPACGAPMVRVPSGDDGLGHRNNGKDDQHGHDDDHDNGQNQDDHGQDDEERRRCRGDDGRSDDYTWGRPGAAAACVQASPVAAPTQSFPAGSLILPMDQCYNRSEGSSPKAWSGSSCVAGTAPACYAAPTYPAGDARLPQGLLYLLTLNRIPVSAVLRPDKRRHSDDDLTVTPPAGATTTSVALLRFSNGAYREDGNAVRCGTAPVSYGGMPYVIHAAHAAQALEILSRHNASVGRFAGVPIHVSHHPFSASVAFKLGGRPRPIGLGPRCGAPSYLHDTGIDSVVDVTTAAVSISAPSGGTDYSFAWPAGLPEHPACPGRLCQGLQRDGQRILDLIWTGDGNLQLWPALGPFFRAGGRAVVVDSAVSTWEGPGREHLLCPEGLTPVGPNAAAGSQCPAVLSTSGLPMSDAGLSYPASDRLLQIGDLPFVPPTTGSHAGWRLNGPAAPDVHALTPGGSGEVVTALSGHPVINGAQTPGQILYMGGGPAWSSPPRDAALRAVSNSAVSDSAPLSPKEIARGGPVAGVGGTYYLGSLDWQVPADTTGLGAVLYQPSPATYPYLTGHLRAYLGGGGGTGLSAVPVACTPGPASAACAWDAATLIRPWGRRNLFVAVPATGSAGNLRLAPIASLQNDPTIAVVLAQIGTQLGAVDRAAAAVIEAPAGSRVVKLSGARDRPTLVYVGARDGLLHAFCAAPPGGACYGGYAPGEEVWAVLLPGQRAQLDDAVDQSDFSTVNLGGVIRVADVSDTFPAATPTSSNSAAAPEGRTVLLVGARSMGRVTALDISAPNPQSPNQPGFQVLWDSDGTNVQSGVPVYPMGRTLGASVALLNGAALALITASIPGGGGINTYAVRLGSGQIVGAHQRRYTRGSPLPGGGVVPIVDTAPPLPVVIDKDGDGVDDTALVADLEGVLRSFPLSASGFPSAPVVLFDASDGRCPDGVACQPLGVAPAVLRPSAGPKLLCLLATGGADWLRDPATPSYLFGLDPTGSAITAPLLQQSLGMLTPPSVASPGALYPVALPLRAYAQPVISGGDLYLHATTVAVGDLDQSGVAASAPGLYAAVLRWRNLGAGPQAVPAAPEVLTAAAAIFDGGGAAPLRSDDPVSGSALVLSGGTVILRLPLSPGDSSLRSRTLSAQGTQSGRSYQVRGWFDLGGR